MAHDFDDAKHMQLPVISIPLQREYDQETKELLIGHSTFYSMGTAGSEFSLVTWMRFDPQATRALSDLIHQIETATGGPIGEVAMPHGAQ